MNAKWLEKISEYRTSFEAQETIRLILNEKITQQLHFPKESPSKWLIPENIPLSKITLFEARAAHHHWIHIKRRLKNKVHLQGRIQHGSDPFNKLLDVGYHFLSGFIHKICESIDMPTELGILHHAQSSSSRPLIYDLIEPFRYIVDHAVIVHFSKKKKLVTELDTYDVPRLINSIKQAMEKKYYHRKRKDCQTLSYWIRLYLLEFRGAVSQHRIANFYFPPKRHDTRCSKKSDS